MVSNGNFHGAPVAYVLDFLAIAAADVASIAERRTDRMLDPARSHGLPPFLADDPGVDSGHMIAQYTQAAIVSELKRLAVPASVDSIPSSAMQEDHVSMGWSAARKLRRAVDGLTRVLAIELLTAARALDLRAPLAPAAGDRRGRRGPAGRGRRRTSRCPPPTGSSPRRSRPPWRTSPPARRCAPRKRSPGRSSDRGAAALAVIIGRRRCGPDGWVNVPVIGPYGCPDHHKTWRSRGCATFRSWRAGPADAVRPGGGT